LKIFKEGIFKLAIFVKAWIRLILNIYLFKSLNIYFKLRVIIESFASWTILAMLANSMMPEVFKEVGYLTRLLTMLGFLTAFILCNSAILWLIEHKLTEEEFIPCGGFKSKNRTSLHICELVSVIIKNLDKCYYQSGCNYHYWSVTLGG